MPEKLTASRPRGSLRFAGIAWLASLCLSCDHGQRIEALEEWVKKYGETYQTPQKTRDDTQDQRTEELASKVECDNPEVRNFIKKCTSEEVCDEGKIVSAVRNMKGMDHVMLRVSYDPEKPIEADTEDRRAQLFKLFRKHQVISGITKLLVVAIPFVGKAQPGVRKPQVAKPTVDYTKLHSQALKFRNSFYNSEYELSKAVKVLDPQVPRCDARTEGLVQIFHNKPEDQLTPSERRIQAPYVDLIVFLVEC